MNPGKNIEDELRLDVGKNLIKYIEYSIWHLAQASTWFSIDNLVTIPIEYLIQEKLIAVYK